MDFFFSLTSFDIKQSITWGCHVRTMDSIKSFFTSDLIEAMKMKPEAKIFGRSTKTGAGSWELLDFYNRL